jgi:hypothetical protein
MITVVVPVGQYDRTFDGATNLEFPQFSATHLTRPTWSLRFTDKTGRTVTVGGPYLVYETKPATITEEEALQNWAEKKAA